MVLLTGRRGVRAVGWLMTFSRNTFFFFFQTKTWKKKWINMKIMKLCKGKSRVWSTNSSSTMPLKVQFRNIQHNPTLYCFVFLHRLIKNHVCTERKIIKTPKFYINIEHVFLLNGWNPLKLLAPPASKIRTKKGSLFIFGNPHFFFLRRNRPSIDLISWKFDQCTEILGHDVITDLKIS